ncbi:MAG: plasma-membrane proton-efflux P-type ATPase [Acidimicrobiales bacterium]
MDSSVIERSLTTGHSKVEGLSHAEAARRRAEFGPNEVAEARVPAWRRLAGRFWGPLPWMLEVTIALTLLLGKDLEGVIITLLLVLNSVIGFVQQSKADGALRLLRQRLEVNARVLRDGTWQAVPARDVMPGDVVRIRIGDLVPADVTVTEGHVSLDQSSLTGESAPAEAGPGERAYGASVVTRGEATGVVEATGERSFYGRTTVLVGQSKTATHLEGIIFQIVRYLVVIDVTLVLVLFAFAAAIGASLSATAPFALIILIASVPVALPTTFTVAQAVGAQELGRGSDEHHPGHGVLVTRLSAVQEAASMDVLCTDKTGTLTQNRLTLGAVVAYSPFGEPDLVSLAGLASDDSGQDPIDLALLRAARDRRGEDEGARREAFSPFDPVTKRTEATVVRRGERLRVVKGMPQVVASLCAAVPPRMPADLDRLAASGARVLAVAVGEMGKGLAVAAVPAAEGSAVAPPERLALVGLVALTDRPRPDSAQLIEELGALGIRVKMVTGDTAATAVSVARQVGIEPTVCTGEDLRRHPELAERCSVFASVFPADKHALVTLLQAAGHVVGMTGDGVNDAPALKQAEVGIAVDSAVDVAKAAASMVLTEPGLVGTVAAVNVSRRIYQRMMTWTLNKIVKTAQVAVFLTAAFVVTRHFVTTPLLVVLLLLVNDFVTMSLAVDRARPSPRPERWQVGPLVAVSLALALVVLAESFLVLWLARGVLGLSWPQTQTLIFLMLVFSGQATVYVVRERGHFWHSAPVKWLLLASVFDIAVVSTIAAAGVLMAPVGIGSVALVLVVALGFMFVMDPVKVQALRRLDAG